MNFRCEERVRKINHSGKDRYTYISRLAVQVAALDAVAFFEAQKPALRRLKVGNAGCGCQGLGLLSQDLVGYARISGYYLRGEGKRGKLMCC